MTSLSARTGGALRRAALVLLFSLSGLQASATAAGNAEPRTGGGAWVLAGKRIYTSPEAPPIDNGFVLVQGGKIVTVAASSDVRIHGEMRMSGCSGGVITAGFQNSHVHFTEPVWSAAGTQEPGVLSGALERMLTRYGYTSVVDTSSDLVNTLALRERIARGEIRGPRIYTTGVALYPPDGIPFYLRDLPPEFLAKLPQPDDAREAIELVRANLTRGADATKLFIATPAPGGAIVRMPTDIARAAAAETHARNALVLAHPTDVDGVRVAVTAGVDVLVHTTIDPPKAQWDDALIRDMIANGMSVVPTLKLWIYELAKTKLPENVRGLALGDALEQLRAFAGAGGQVLFGTDVGYMTDYDPAEEYVLMARAGLTPMRILTSLTTAPARRWNESSRRGQVKAGMDADLVVLGGDPVEDVRNFANVRCTFRAGQEIFAKREGGF